MVYPYDIASKGAGKGGDPMTNEKRPAEADRDDLQKLTRRVEKLEKECLFLLKEITVIHQGDLELGKILQDLFESIANSVEEDGGGR